MAYNPYGLYDYRQQAEPQGDKAATPENFSPKYTKEQLNSIIESYKRNPGMFKPEQVDSIKQHAIYHNTGFYEGDFQISEAIKQFMGGIFEGFSTFEVVDPPDNEYEALSRNIGHLLGFAPGLAARPLKLLGLRNAAAGIAGWKSIPLAIGEKATKLTGKALNQVIPTARADATGTVSKFLLGGATKSVVEEGFKLGVASAVSNWKQGVDGMWEAAKQGGEFGGVFQFLANMVPGSGPFKYLLRATAGSMYQGMHAEAAGATTPEKIYEYLLGAYFGGGATGWVQRDKAKFFKERNEQMYGTKGKKADHKAQATGDPTLIKTWDKYEPTVQKEIIRELNDPNYYGEGKPSENWRPQHQLKDGETYPERTAMLEHVVKQMGIDTKAEVVSDNGWARYLRMQEDAIMGRKPTNLALKTEKELNDLNVEKKELSEKLQKLQAESTTLKGSEKVLADTESNRISNRLKTIEAREKELLDLKPFEWIDKEDGKKVIKNERIHDDGNDIGMVSGRDLSRKSEVVVDRHMKELWDKDTFDPIDSRNEKLRLTSLVDDIVNQDKYVGPEKKINTKELVEEIKTKIKADHDIDIKISKETENELRQYLTRHNFAKPVQYLNIVVDNEGKIGKIGLRDDGFTFAGNRKISVEPKKEAQRILEEVLNLPKDEVAPEAVVVLDNLTFRGPKGAWNDGTLSDVRKLIQNVKGRKGEEARKLYDKMVGETHKEMAKDGYYPYGGKGDNDIIIYIKKHPDVADSTKRRYIEDYITDLKKDLKNDTYYNDAIKRNKHFDKSEAESQYISNIMWDLSLNGFKPKTKQEYKEALDKIMKGEGYIHNATAWNKRQQIWFTPAFRADKGFIYNNYQTNIKKLSKADQALINPTFTTDIADGKVSYIIARDLDPALFNILPDGTKKRIKKLDKDSKNTEMDEHVDGQIIVEDSVLRSIIKDAGMPESGQSKSFIVSPDSSLGALLGKYMMHSAGPKASRQMRETGIHMIMQESAVKQRGERQITDYNIKKTEDIDTFETAKGSKYILNKDNTTTRDKAPRPEHPGQEGPQPKSDVTMFIDSSVATKLKARIGGLFNLKGPGALEKVSIDAGSSKPLVVTMKDGKVHRFEASNKPSIGKHPLEFWVDAQGPHLGNKITKISKSKSKLEKLVIDDPNLIYKLPLEHIKYSYSVKNDDAMIGRNPNGSIHRHGVPKQLLMAMAQNTHQSFPKELIEDFFQETVHKRYQGNKEINEIYKDYKNNPKSKKLLRMLEDNIEQLGVENLLDAINGNPTNFSDAAYIRLMKLQKESIKHRVADGELTPEEAERLTTNMEDFNSAMDRIIEAGQSWKVKENLLGREGNINPLLMHKWIRPYRFQVIRNYIFNSLSRPKVSNSGVARMRGYDKWFQRDKKFADLETNDEIFYLDDAFKKMPLKTTIKGYEDTTLGELWFKYLDKNPKTRFGKDKKERAEEVFTALTVRVPMDSVSGAQRMVFKGFTGRPGHGILMHSKAMKAEGGADLDGDESFIFFGGRRNNKGGGFKKEWIDKFHENKEEFYEPDGTIFNNKNDEAVKSLTMQDSKTTTGIDPKARDSKMWQYDSQWRQDISERAVDGRNLLGGTVSAVQVVKAAHNSILAFPGAKESYTVRTGNKTYRIEIEARTDEAELKKARQLASSMIAFTSDPLDVAGLTGYKDYVSKITNAYFKVKINGKDSKVDADNIWRIINKEGTIGQMKDINSALYSRDFYNDKSWDAIEINEKTSYLKENSIYPLSDPKTHNSMLTKIGRLAADVELYDSPFRMINRDRLVAMYNDYNEIATKIPMFKDLLDNIKVEPNKLALKIMKNEVYEKVNLDRIVDNLPEFYEYINHAQSMYKPGGSNRKNFNSRYAEMNRQYRVGKLKDLIKFSEDTISQDISDMVSVRQLYRYYDGVDVNPTLFKKILKSVNQIKSNSYLQRNNMTEADRQEATWKQIRKSFGVKEMELPEKTMTLDQAKIDAEILKVKKTLPNPRAVKLFDMMMLGTFRHASMGTGVNKLGFSSKSIDSTSLRDFVGDFTQVMNKAYKKSAYDKATNDAIFKEVRFEKDLPEGTILEDTTTGYEGLHGKPDMKKIPKQVRQELTELVERMKSYNGKIGQNLNLIVRDLLGKDFNAMDYADIKNLNRYFRELQRGSIWQRLFREKTPDLRKRYTMLFPLTINRETMKYDIHLMKKRGLFMTQAGEIASGDMLRPTNITEKLHHAITLSMDKAQAKGDEEVFKLRRELEFLDGIDEGEAFRRIAVRKIEADGNVSRTLGRSDKAGRIWAHNYIDSLKKEIKDTNYDVIEGNRYRITERTKDGETKRIEYTGKELVNKVKNVYIKHFKNMHKLIRGNPKLLDNYHQRDRYGRKMYYDFYDYKKFDDPINGGKRKAPMEPIYNYKRFIKDIYEAYERGHDITPELGIDGIRAMARSMMIKLHDKRKQRFMSLEDFRKKVGLTRPTGDLSEGYWPHMLFDKTLASNALKSSAEKVMKSKMSKKAKEEELRKLQLRSKTLTGDWINGTENWDFYSDVYKPKKERSYNSMTWKESLQMTSSMHKRTSHIPGHSIDASVAEVYTRNSFRVYYKQLAQMLSRDALQEFDSMAIKNKWHKIFTPGSNISLKDRWHNWYSLYVQDALGHPSVVPEYMIKDPGMKLKGTPYAWWADNVVTNKMNKVARKLGLKSPVKDMDKFDLNDIRNWSNMEARFELMALLAHPKSMMTNLFGGTLHTIQSAGATALRKVYNYGFLKQINPDWTSRQAIIDFAVKQGVFPEMLAHEWGMQNKLQSAKSKSFIKEVVENVSKKGTVDMKKMRELRQKHGVGHSVMEFAAKFMSKPEMKLRTDAFMSHYIKAWERFGGAITQHDHPFLIEMAKKGVKASQFLYDSVNRPAFARTGLGKIMTRFQLWSWNAWRFRNDVNREARIRGYRQGTPEYERFKRTAQIDLMVYALGSVFAMSLFDNAIPAPYNHLKETSEWLFGDEKERERAFWGTYPRAIAPLQAITPPVVSRAIEGLKAMANEDYDKFLDYHIYTFMPFGRIIRDVSPWSSGNLIDNPYRFIEKTTGLPYGAVQKERKKFKEQTAYHPTFNVSSQLREQLED